MRNLSCIYSLDILKPGCTGVLTEQFAPGAGELMFFNTWSVLNSPLCPGGGGGAWFQMTKALLCFIKETMSTTMHLFTFYLESDGMSTNNDYKHFFGALSLQFC
jgi:hypothetical protein